MSGSGDHSKKPPVKEQVVEHLRRELAQLRKEMEMERTRHLEALAEKDRQIRAAARSPPSLEAKVDPSYNKQASVYRYTLSEA